MALNSLSYRHSHHYFLIFASIEEKMTDILIFINSYDLRMVKNEGTKNKEEHA